MAHRGESQAHPHSALVTRDASQHEPRRHKSRLVVDETPRVEEQSAVTAQGPKPNTFFELLAAAVSKAKQDKNKGPEFLGYLKRSGIRTAWVRAIVALYEEPTKPDDPLAYILKLMGFGIPEVGEVYKFQDKVRQLRTKVLQLQSEKEDIINAIKQEQEAYRDRLELTGILDDDWFISPYNSDEEPDPDADKKGTC